MKYQSLLAPQRTLDYLNAVREILESHNYLYNPKQIRELAATFHVSSSRINEAISSGLFKYERSADLNRLLVPTKLDKFTIKDAMIALKGHLKYRNKKKENLNQIRLNIDNNWTTKGYDNITMLKDLLKLLRQEGYEIKCEISTKKEL